MEISRKDRKIYRQSGFAAQNGWRRVKYLWHAKWLCHAKRQKGKVASPHKGQSVKWSMTGIGLGLKSKNLFQKN